MRHSKPVRLGNRPCRLVGSVFNCADAVRLETAPTGGENVHLFLVFIIISEQLSIIITWPVVP